jgi:polyisoprenoid-binding protein YceI
MATYQIDPTHSAVQFQIRHLNIANIKGQFGKVTGTVNFDPANAAASTVDAAIDVNSILTRDEKRDAHLKTGDFFDVEKHPTITFKSTGVTAAGKDSFTVNGDLTFRGVTKGVSLVVEGLTGEVNDMWGNLRRGASAKTRIKRGDFGLTFNAPLKDGGFLLSDNVDIEIDLQMLRPSAA